MQRKRRNGSTKEPSHFVPYNLHQIAAVIHFHRPHCSPFKKRALNHKHQHDVFTWSEVTDAVYTEHPEPLTPEDALLPNRFWKDMCSSIGRGDSTASSISPSIPNAIPFTMAHTFGRPLHLRGKLCSHGRFQRDAVFRRARTVQTVVGFAHFDDHFHGKVSTSSRLHFAQSPRRRHGRNFAVTIARFGHFAIVQFGR